MKSSSSDRQVGKIVSLWRYPVKSMAAEALDECDVSWNGLAGDRRWAFVRDGVEKSGFPWFTQRQRANMGHYRPSFVDPDRPDNSATEVKAPDGTSFDITDKALAENLGGEGVRVIRQARGIFDTFPLSLITTQTIDRLSETVGLPLDVQRFRPNLLVQASGEAPFQEDDWVGRVLRIGEVRMRVDQRDGRCLVVTIDPVTSEHNPEILRAVARDRQGCLGVYGSTVEPGRIRVGDPVSLGSAA